MEELKHFEKLYKIDCSDKTEKKSNGSVELTYLSWCYAWAETKKLYPNAKYEIMKFGEQQLPYVYDEKTGYMVFTKVEIEGITHEMWLPVMDSANKAMKDKPYTYKVATWGWQDRKRVKTGEVEKQVEAATMFDINKTIMRCLTKNLAMFGLGLYIYAGEDLPENLAEEETKPVEIKKTTTKTAVKKNVAAEYAITEDQKKKIKTIFTPEEIKQHLEKIKKSKLSDLSLVEASEFIKTKLVEEK